MEKGLTLSRSGPDASQPYRELLGSLMYIMLSVRPEICYPVGYLGHFQQQPTTEHWQALKRAVRYLQGTIKTKLNFKRDPTSKPLVGYVEADWASDTEDRKSVSGYLFKVFGSSVIWCSKKQTTVTTSSSEAEFIALSAAVPESLWLKEIIEDLQDTNIHITTYEDNRSCICMA
ncbi:uncharacterized protein LOC134221468 [Armigeres subalbatus]|uniref:uncharacterized protein LOC134221468 n=1 Tax=Armigeres subalbatus TaxID=124917 RepID=UPI002ECFE9DE